MAQEIELRATKVEYAVVLWPDTPPDEPFYDTCREASDVVMMAGGGFVVQRAYYETGWLPHEPH